MKPRDISKTKQIIVQALCVITVAAIIYVSITLYGYDKILFWCWIISVGSFLAYTVFIEPNMILTPVREIVIENLPAHFKGKRFAHISDIHFGPLFGKNALRRLVNKINGLKLDFICFTGDFLSVNKSKEIDILVEEIKNLKARYGIFAVFGNHDYYGGAKYLKEKLTENGVNFLVNQSAAIANGDDRIWILGVDDPYHKYDELDAALKGVPPDEPKILLAHTPEIIPEAVEKNIDLVLLGHTHGGQARLPGYKLVLTLSKKLKKYISGLFLQNKTYFYITRGIGRVTLPIRFLSPPEVAVFVFR